jgi:hypothetical protein
VLGSLPSEGPLFPYLRTVRAGDRATEFKQRCAGLNIKGVTLHSYRYAWAQRARKAGYPERFAMENLGHNSKNVHWAYAGLAEVELPSLGEFERQRAAFANGNGEPGAVHSLTGPERIESIGARTPGQSIVALGAGHEQDRAPKAVQESSSCR